MSKIGLKPILIPAGTKVTVDKNTVTVEGAKGKLQREFPREIKLEIENDKLIVKRTGDEKTARSFHGLYRSLLSNMITGVSAGFETVLEIKGVGFRAEVAGSNLKMALGFSYPLLIPIPKGLTVKVEGQLLKISGIDKERVSGFAAVLRAIKKPDAYKGKGLRYQGEVIHLKPGKSAKGTTAGAGVVK